MGVSPGLLERIRGEFLEMPGLKLTPAQACRLWNANEAVCREALGALIAEGFLLQTPSGAFIAVPSAAKMAKAIAVDARRSWRCQYCQHLNSRPAGDWGPPRAGMTFRCMACARVASVDSAIS